MENQINEVYALRAECEFDMLASLKKGEGRFGWSYVETADLRKLRQRIEKGNSLTPEEKDCYQAFLLDFQENDYVVYINIPAYGECTVARITGPYEWRWDNEHKDFSHRFSVDPKSVYSFDRNSDIVHPHLRARFKLQGRWWRIYSKSEFSDLLGKLKAGQKGEFSTPESDFSYLAKEIQPSLLEITKAIQRTHPDVQLERLLEKVFKNVPGVLEVKRQGGAGDHGADLLVTYESGLPIPELTEQHTLVVQVKSFAGEHWDTQAVEDIRRAFDHYAGADRGLIVSTAKKSAGNLERELDKLRERGKPVALLIGHQVAAFILKHYPILLD